MIQSSFSIKLITDPTDKDYIKSLNVYNSTTPVNIKTNSNEISYWINHNNDSFKIYCFSLFIGKENVGFAMTSFLLKSKLLVRNQRKRKVLRKNNFSFFFRHL